MKHRRFNRAAIPPKDMNFNAPVESQDVEANESAAEHQMEMEQGIQENNIPQMPMRASRPMRVPQQKGVSRGHHYKSSPSKNWKASSYKSKASPRPPL